MARRVFLPILALAITLLCIPYSDISASPRSAPLAQCDEGQVFNSNTRKCECPAQKYRNFKLEDGSSQVANCKDVSVTYKGTCGGSEEKTISGLTNGDKIASISPISSGFWVATRSSDEKTIRIYAYDHSANFIKIVDTIPAPANYHLGDYPHITTLKNGSVLVSWVQRRVDAINLTYPGMNREYWIFAQKYDETGKRYGARQLLSNFTLGGYYVPRVSVQSQGFGDGGYLISWYINAGDPDTWNARAFDADGNPTSSVFPINIPLTATCFIGMSRYSQLQTLQNGDILATVNTYPGTGEPYCTGDMRLNAAIIKTDGTISYKISDAYNGSISTNGVLSQQQDNSFLAFGRRCCGNSHPGEIVVQKLDSNLNRVGTATYPRQGVNSLGETNYLVKGTAPLSNNRTLVSYIDFSGGTNAGNILFGIYDQNGVLTQPEFVAARARNTCSNPTSGWNCYGMSGNTDLGYDGRNYLLYKTPNDRFLLIYDDNKVKFFDESDLDACVASIRGGSTVASSSW